MANISIVIPTRNRYDYLKMAVDSALVQTLPPTEVIIVDDGSAREVADKMARRWADHAIVRVHALPEKGGVSRARNIGKELSIGDYLLFLDDDDMLLPDMLEKCMDEMGGTDIVGCRTRMISDDAGLSKAKIKSYRWGYSQKAEVYRLNEDPVSHLLLHAPSIHSFLGKASVLKTRDFDENLKYGEDLDYWVRLALGGASFHKVEFEGVVYRMHRKNASATTVVDGKKQFYHKLLSNPELNSGARHILTMKRSLVLKKDQSGITIDQVLRAAFSPWPFNRHFWFFVRLFWAGRF